ncbi:TPA: hypothetical protein ACGOR9_002215 [Streptococcus suis]
MGNAIDDRILNRLHKWVPGFKILGVGNNKLDQEKICILDASQEYLYLIDKRTLTIVSCPKISFKVNEEESGSLKITIQDIVVTTVDEGDGSILMDYLLNYAKDIGVTHLSGQLSNSNSQIDEERRNHFYRKFGFSINGNQIAKVL